MARLEVVARLAVVARLDAAQRAEDKKRNKTQPGSQARMEMRLKARGIDFLPLGFDTSGTPGSSWSKLLKTLVETASERHGHDKQTFRMKWMTRMSCCLAKRGAQAALRRAYLIAHGNRRRFRKGPNNGSDRLGAHHAEPLFTVTLGSGGA